MSTPSTPSTPPAESTTTPADRAGGVRRSRREATEPAAPPSRYSLGTFPNMFRSMFVIGLLRPRARGHRAAHHAGAATGVDAAGKASQVAAQTTWPIQLPKGLGDGWVPTVATYAPGTEKVADVHDGLDHSERRRHRLEAGRRRDAGLGRPLRRRRRGRRHRDGLGSHLREVRRERQGPARLRRQGGGSQGADPRGERDGPGGRAQGLRRGPGAGDAGNRCPACARPARPADRRPADRGGQEPSSSSKMSSSAWSSPAAAGRAGGPLDLGLRPVEPRRAVRGQCLAATPQLHRVLERRLTRLELRDDRDELLAGVLVAHAGDVGERAVGRRRVSHGRHPTTWRRRRRPTRVAPRSRPGPRGPAAARPPRRRPGP